VESDSARRRFVRRVPRLRPHQRVLLVTLAALIGAGTGFGVIMARSGPPLTALNSVTQRLEPIGNELQKVEDAAHTGQRRFEDALSATEPAVRTAALQDAEAATQDGQRAWSAYRHIALGLPTEARLQADYEKQAKTSRDAGVVLFTTDVNNPSLGVRVRRTVAPRGRCRDAAEHRCDSRAVRAEGALDEPPG
jgi:hypothetical protein